MSTVSADNEINTAKPKSFEGLWRFLKYSFLAFVAANIALVISNLAALQYFYKIQYGEFLSEETLANVANFTDMHQGLAAILVLFTFISSVFAYSRFQYRAMKNLHVLDAAGVETSPGWSVGYFFVPIANLWKPFGAVCQIWRGTFDPEDGEARVPAIIGWWWAAWLIMNFIDNASLRLSTRAGAFGEEITDIDLYMGTLVLDIASALIGVVAAVLVLKFMERIRDGQEALIQRSLASEF